MFLSGVRGNGKETRTGKEKKEQVEGISCYLNTCENEAVFLGILSEQGKGQGSDGGWGGNRRQCEKEEEEGRDKVKTCLREQKGDRAVGIMVGLYVLTGLFQS